MTGDEYLRGVLNKYFVLTGQGSVAYTAASQVCPVIRKWAGGQLREIYFSGSYSKGTGIKGETDVDLLISLKSDTTNTLKELFEGLHSRMTTSGYPAARKQHVSIHINHNGVDVDLVPGVKHEGNTEDHWLYVNRAGRERIQTNIDKHISLVRNSGRVDEIRVIKLWRKLHSLDICSFYLELAVIEALNGYRSGQVASNVLRVLDYLRDDFAGARFVDPANSNNIISDELTAQEKSVIAGQARISRLKQTWEEIVW